MDHRETCVSCQVHGLTQLPAPPRCRLARRTALLLRAVRTSTRSSFAPARTRAGGDVTLRRVNPPAVELVVPSRPRVIGGLPVGRVLPWFRRRSVGPFVFLDHLGPIELAPGAPFDVLPHPHIGLATVTYFFAGEALHRDSVGSRQMIVPGDVNWMSAGRGIAHSERSTDAQRSRGGALHGMQFWVALPRAHEDAEPWFAHHPAATLPLLELGEHVRVRLLAGAAWGARSPVAVASPLFQADAELDAGARLELPRDLGARAVYVASGAVAIDGEVHGARELLVLAPAASALVALEPARVLLFGGEPLPEPRLIEWNFVASSRERIDAAKRAWRERRFPRVAGETDEFVPLPGEESS